MKKCLLCKKTIRGGVEIVFNKKNRSQVMHMDCYKIAGDLERAREARLAAIEKEDTTTSPLTVSEGQVSDGGPYVTPVEV